MLIPLIPQFKSLPVSDKQTPDGLQVFRHHIYEYKKGIRRLILTTEKIQNRTAIEKRLEREGIAYHINQISSDKINVFFGNTACVNMVSTFNPKLNKITPEQDFILGILLGYDIVQGCNRYFKMKDKFTLN